MKTTDKYSCRILVRLLVAHGVKNVILSPGSRNIPLMLAASRCDKLKSTVIVDERTAAFMALGMASVTGTPTAIICTSGTALLNYAPAIAEAFYRHIPLVVISADRPYQWIDQDDSQTIRQSRALDNIIKYSCDIPDNSASPLDKWYAERVINEALINMQRGCAGPVHINIQLSEPLNGCVNDDIETDSVKVIKCDIPDESLSEQSIEYYARRITDTPKVMIVAGFLSTNNHRSIERNLEQLGKRSNIAVLTESISNLKISNAIECIDIAVSGITPANSTLYRPDILITIGGALISRFIKQFLRKNKPTEHWHIGHTHSTVDCMQALTHHVDIAPDAFMEALCQHMNQPCITSDYSEIWALLYQKQTCRRDLFVKNCNWCDLKVFANILPRIPLSYNLQLSNGTPIRYAQLFADKVHVNRTDCNRGVSGIDGSTSTAIGAAMVYEHPTLLITGDTSAQYDVGALAVRQIPDNFKIIIINNGGGGIFRFISSTSEIEEREQLFGDPINLPVQPLASTYKFQYFIASNEEQLNSILPQFFNAQTKCILEINGLPTDESAGRLRTLLHIPSLNN